MKQTTKAKRKIIHNAVKRGCKEYKGTFRLLAGDENKAKANRPKKTIRENMKKTKLIPFNKLVAKADRIFSLYIRKRDSRCVLCNSTTNLQCGHLFKRSKKSVRWNEINCNTLCNGCNYRDNFDHDHYVNWFLKKYGERKYAQLYLKAQKVKKFAHDRHALEIIIKKYSSYSKS